jgi:hypothetical protein
MSKKTLPVAVADEATWRDGDEDLAETFSENPVAKPSKSKAGKPSRQRIEEYFERKRLAEALQEDFTDDYFQ